MPEAANCFVFPAGTLGLVGVTVMEMSVAVVELLVEPSLGDEPPPPPPPQLGTKGKANKRVIIIIQRLVRIAWQLGGSRFLLYIERWLRGPLHKGGSDLLLNALQYSQIT